MWVVLGLGFPGRKKRKKRKKSRKKYFLVIIGVFEVHLYVSKMGMCSDTEGHVG